MSNTASHASDATKAMLNNNSKDNTVKNDNPVSDRSGGKCNNSGKCNDGGGKLIDKSGNLNDNISKYKDGKFYDNVNKDNNNKRRTITPPIHVTQASDVPPPSTDDACTLSPGYASYSETLRLPLPTEYDCASHDDLSADETYELHQPSPPQEKKVPIQG